MLSDDFTFRILATLRSARRLAARRFASGGAMVQRAGAVREATPRSATAADGDGRPTVPSTAAGAREGGRRGTEPVQAPPIHRG